MLGIVSIAACSAFGTAPAEPTLADAAADASSNEGGAAPGANNNDGSAVADSGSAVWRCSTSVKGGATQPLCEKDRTYQGCVDTNASPDGLPCTPTGTKREYCTLCPSGAISGFRDFSCACTN
jgi:hypothetical protein